MMKLSLASQISKKTSGKIISFSKGSAFSPDFEIGNDLEAKHISTIPWLSKQIEIKGWLRWHYYKTYYNYYKQRENAYLALFRP